MDAEKEAAKAAYKKKVQQQLKSKRPSSSETNPIADTLPTQAILDGSDTLAASSETQGQPVPSKETEPIPSKKVEHSSKAR